MWLRGLRYPQRWPEPRRRRRTSSVRTSRSAGPSTLTGCPSGASADFAAAYDNTEVEPQVAVNPTNPNEIVGRVPAGPLARRRRARADVVDVDNGGASWAKLPDVPWSACQGGPARFGRVTDPWVSYDKGGNLYFIGQPIDSAALGHLGDRGHDVERDEPGGRRRS